MCGRYALGIRASYVRQQLQELNLRVDDAPADDEVRETYNFPPGAYGLVYRADVPDAGLNDSDIEALQYKKATAPKDKAASELLPAQDEHQTQARSETDKPHPPPPNSPGFMKASALLDQGNTKDQSTNKKELKYQLKAMKWGLIPFWTKRAPDYGSMMRTINCRDDSLIENRGLWNTMKQRKRCLVLAQGFYEWLKPRDSRGSKIPHFVKRKDGQLMCFAGLWDCVKYDDTADGEKLYTYTVITTNSNEQLQFLHDRMPVILDPGTKEMEIWLDATRNKWSPELQAVLKPFEGELECYPVSKEVGKVGNNSPDFIVPLASKDNKQNIANFFSGGNGNTSPPSKKHDPHNGHAEVKAERIKQETQEERITADHDGTENTAPMPVPSPTQGGLKRKLSINDEGQADHATKQVKLEPVSTPQRDSTSFKSEVSSLSSPARSPVTPTPKVISTFATAKTGAKKTRDPTSNAGLERKLSPAKNDGTQRITSFFAKTDSPG